ncbi:MAG TPA: ChaN family lipoprotein, partial [Psychromonas sp.]
MQKADVVLVGEWHGHSGIHRFQTDLLRAMTQRNPNLALSMEQFTRDKQEIVDQYLAGEIGEATLIKEADAWPNYESNYRPLVELAKAEKIDVIAANAPIQIVRCIAKEGMAYLNRLPEKERAWLAASISVEDSAYKRRFMVSVHHGDEAQNSKQFAAQATWDETMAESIVHYLEQHPNKQVMHIAGKFHI